MLNNGDSKKYKIDIINPIMRVNLTKLYDVNWRGLWNIIYKVIIAPKGIPIEIEAIIDVIT